MNSKFKDAIFLYVCLAAGSVLLVFSNLNQAIPIAAWITPVFLIRYMRMQKSIAGLILGAFTIIIAYIIMWLPVIGSLNPWMMILSISFLGLSAFLVFLADKILTVRFKGIASTLVFPLLWTIVEYIRSFIPSSGIFGSVANSQYGNLPLLQIVSITGIWGLVFLMSWFAAVVNFILENDFEPPKIRKVLILFTSVFIIILIYGGARVSLFPPGSETVRMAAITSGSTGADFASIYKYKKFPSLEDNEKKIDELSHNASAGGAKIIVWQEYCFQMAKEDEIAFTDYCEGLAKRENVYISAGLAVYEKNLKGKGKNISVLVNPEGRVDWRYVKHNLVPGLETVKIASGKPVLPFVQTPYGKLSTAICRDLDFPQYLEQAGRGGADILLNPALDWKETSPFHAYMAVFRAIENGFSIMRSAGEGLSVAADYQGNVLAARNDFTTKGKVMFADVPVKGVRTIYSYIGDFFAWLCFAGMILMLIFYFVKKRKVS